MSYASDALQEFAQTATDPKNRAEYLKMEKSWLRLADSYQDCEPGQHLPPRPTYNRRLPPYRPRAQQHLVLVADRHDGTLPM
jgi:hypothetical protein